MVGRAPASSSGPRGKSQFSSTATLRISAPTASLTTRNMEKLGSATTAVRSGPRYTLAMRNSASSAPEVTTTRFGGTPRPVASSDRSGSFEACGYSFAANRGASSTVRSQATGGHAVVLVSKRTTSDSGMPAAAATSLAIASHSYGSSRAMCSRGRKGISGTHEAKQASDRPSEHEARRNGEHPGHDDLAG